MLTRIVLCLAAVAWLAGALPASAAEKAEASPTPRLPIIEHKGIVVSRDEAFRRISFTPILPVAQPLEIALIAPFHGGDDERNYGVGFEYVQRNHTFFFREWPRAGGNLTGFNAIGTLPICKEAYITNGDAKNVVSLAWLTTRFAYSLELDDVDPPRDHGKALKEEWTRLANRGACR